MILRLYVLGISAPDLRGIPLNAAGKGTSGWRFAAIISERGEIGKSVYIPQLCFILLGGEEIELDITPEVF